MNSNQKIHDAYKTIGEITKELDLINKKTGRLQTHTLRYWQKQFKQINPAVKAGKRRYYSNKDLKIIKFVKFLLKEKGLTIKGVKKILNKKQTHMLDDNSDIRENKINTESTKFVKDKLRKISKIVKELKNIKNG